MAKFENRNPARKAYLEHVSEELAYFEKKNADTMAKIKKEIEGRENINQQRRFKMKESNIAETVKGTVQFIATRKKLIEALAEIKELRDKVRSQKQTIQTLESEAEITDAVIKALSGTFYFDVKNGLMFDLTLKTNKNKRRYKTTGSISVG